MSVTQHPVLLIQHPVLNLATMCFLSCSAQRFSARHWLQPSRDTSPLLQAYQNLTMGKTMKAMAAMKATKAMKGNTKGSKGPKAMQRPAAAKKAMKKHQAMKTNKKTKAPLH